MGAKNVALLVLAAVVGVPGALFASIWQVRVAREHPLTYSCEAAIVAVVLGILRMIRRNGMSGRRRSDGGEVLDKIANMLK